MQLGKTLAAAVGALIVLIAMPSAFADQKTDRMADLFESSIAQESSGNIDRALDETLDILKLEPKHYLANYRAAWLYYYKGNYAKSVVYYENAAEIQPDSLEAKLGLLLPLMAEKKWTRAQSLAEKLYAQAPYNYYAGSRLAYIYYSHGKYDLAAGQYKKVLKAFPSETDMTLGLGWTYLKLGKKELARNAFAEVLLIKKNNLSAKTGMESL